MVVKVILCGFYLECNMILMLFFNVLNVVEVWKCVMGGEFEVVFLKMLMVLYFDLINIMIFFCFLVLNYCNFL